MKKKIILILTFLFFSMSINLCFGAVKKPETKQYDPENLTDSPEILLEGQTSFEKISEYKKITLNEAINHALNNNLDIKKYRLNIDISSQNIKSAGKFENPSIGTFFNLGKAGYSEPHGVNTVIPVDLFKRGARKNLAKADLELTKNEIALEELNLRLQVRKAYIDLAAAKSNLKLLEENQKTIMELNTLAKKKLKTKK